MLPGVTVRPPSPPPPADSSSPAASRSAQPALARGGAGRERCLLLLPDPSDSGTLPTDRPPPTGRTRRPADRRPQATPAPVHPVRPITARRSTPPAAARRAPDTLQPGARSHLPAHSHFITRCWKAAAAAGLFNCISTGGKYSGGVSHARRRHRDSCHHKTGGH